MCKGELTSSHSFQLDSGDELLLSRYLTDDCINPHLTFYFSSKPSFFI